MYQSTKLALLAIALVGGALVPAAFAASDGPYTTSTPVSATTTDWLSSLTFPQFDASLGTLTGVQLDLSGTFDTIITVTNNSIDTGSSGTAKTEVDISVDDGSNNLAPPAQLQLITSAFAYSLGAGGSITSPTITKSGTSSDTYTSPAVLAEFTGAGTITLPASTFTQTLLANTGGNTAALQSTTAALTGTVTYLYAPVPEPGTMALLGLGMVGIVAFGRRHRRSA